jgi:hypothetical protein
MFFGRRAGAMSSQLPRGAAFNTRKTSEEEDILGGRRRPPQRSQLSHPIGSNAAFVAPGEAGIGRLLNHEIRDRIGKWLATLVFLSLMSQSGLVEATVEIHQTDIREGYRFLGTSSVAQFPPRAARATHYKIIP